MTPTDIGIYAFWLFIAVVFIRWLFAHNTKDDEGYREYIDQLEAQRIAQAQAAQQEWERRQRQANSGATQQQSAYDRLRHAYFHEQEAQVQDYLRGQTSVYNHVNQQDESKEIKRLKEQNKKLMERINYIENKE